METAYTTVTGSHNDFIKLFTFARLNPNISGNNKGNAQSADKYGIDGQLMNFHSSNSGYFETSIFQCKYLNINSLPASSQSFLE